MGYMLLFTADEYIEPSVYDIRDEDKVYETMTPFCTKAAMNNMLTTDNTTSASMRITFALAVSQRYFAQFDEVFTSLSSR
jgi:hypothetical protein